jgi:hypothetical protein
VSEFDFRKNWTIIIGRTSARDKDCAGPNVVKLYNMNRPEVLRWLRDNGHSAYKLESEEI